MYEIHLSNGDWAETETFDAALLAAVTMMSEAEPETTVVFEYMSIHSTPTSPMTWAQLALVRAMWVDIPTPSSFLK